MGRILTRRASLLAGLGATAAVALPEPAGAGTSATNKGLDARLEELESNRVINANAGYEAAAGIRCDGTDDSARWTALIAAVPEGSTIFWRGNSTISSQVVVNRCVNLVGASLESAITVDVGTSTDGLVIGTEAALMYGLNIGNFCVLGGVGSCRHGLVVRNLVDCDVGPLYVK